MSDQGNSPLPQAPSSPEKEGMSTGCIVALVLGVVCFVLVLIIPLGSVRLGIGGRSLKAKAQMQGLVLGVKAYQTEYNRLPSPQASPPREDNTSGYDTTSAEGKKIIEALTGTDAEKNPRQVPLYEPSVAIQGRGGYSPTGGLVDVWGSNGYIIVLDYNGDSQITNPEDPGTNIEAAVIVYSAGPDHDYSTWKDNVKSWD